MKDFKIDSNPFHEITSSVYLLPIRLLDLSNTKISSIPLNENKNNTISSFVATNTDIIIFPIQVCSFQALKLLDLTLNNIVVVPPEISNCINLSMIILSNNKIETISPKLFELNVEFLFLKYNNLEFLPSIQKKVSSNCTLKILDISNNKLSFIQNDVFSNLNIERLFLSFNYLERFPSLSPSIQQLIIKSNKLTNVTHLEEISDYNQFSFLDISNNQLEGFFFF